MSRPALSAARGAQLLGFLASFPERRFTLTEIARATGINAASCLAILGELVEHGFLCRHEARKTYWLGPALIAAGTSALMANPILARAHATAGLLRDDLDLPVLLSAQIDDEIVCIFSLTDAKGRMAGLRAGDRVPLVPPVGASFVAWSTPRDVEAWIARRAEGGAAAVAQALHKELETVRQRGFHVTLRRRGADDVTSFLARVATGMAAPDSRQVAAFVETLDVEAAQPDTLSDDAAYDVHLIAAPVIDAETRAIYNLCLGGLDEPVAGATIADLGRRLTTACLAIMTDGDRR